MIWSADTFRSWSGLSEMNMRPVFCVLRLPPVKATTAVAAGSVSTMFTNSAIFSRIAGNEMSCEA